MYICISVYISICDLYIAVYLCISLSVICKRAKVLMWPIESFFNSLLYILATFGWSNYYPQLRSQHFLPPAPEPLRESPIQLYIFHQYTVVSSEAFGEGALYVMMY